MTPQRRVRHLALLLLLPVLAGCGRRAPRPAERAGEVTATVAGRLAQLDAAIEAKAFGVPAVVRGLLRDLKEMRDDFTGDRGALDASTAKLEDWYRRSHDRRTDTDADREELKAIVSEVRAALATRGGPEGAPETADPPSQPD
jgi:hypothetical protein